MDQIFPSSGFGTSLSTGYLPTGLLQDKGLASTVLWGFLCKKNEIVRAGLPPECRLTTSVIYICCFIWRKNLIIMIILLLLDCWIHVQMFFTTVMTQANPMFFRFINEYVTKVECFEKLKGFVFKEIKKQEHNLRCQVLVLSSLYWGGPRHENKKV